MTPDEAVPPAPAKPGPDGADMFKAGVLHAAFLQNPAAQRVMAALSGTGVPAGPARDLPPDALAARFVGGCVRNALLGLPVDDIDIATPLVPAEIAAAAKAAGIGIHETGIDHGTLTLSCDGYAFEVTTLRADIVTDGRHAIVAFTQDWATDASRRDFTINALYADAEGRLHDPTGEGLRDLAARRVRFIGEPAQRLREDHLRALRFFRFHAHFGAGPIDPAGLAACAALGSDIANVSRERIWREFRKLLAAADPRSAILAMADIGSLAHLAPECSDLARFQALVANELATFSPPDPLLRVAALLADAAAAERLSQAMRMSRAEQMRLLAALAPDPVIVSWASAREMRRWLYRFGRAAVLDRIRLAWAQQATKGTRSGAEMQWRTLIPMAETWTPPAFPVSGDSFIAAGIPQGPLIGKARAELESWWIDLDFPDDPLAMEERLKAIAQGFGGFGTP